MKKNLAFVPLVGLFTTIYFQAFKGELIVDDEERPIHFYVSAFIQAISFATIFVAIVLWVAVAISS